MKILIIVAMAITGASSALPQAVPLTGEHHHHFVLSNDNVRVYNVMVNPGDATLLHVHHRDYIWVAVGASRIGNQLEGQAEVDTDLPDASVHFSRAPLTHIARNTGHTVFHNVTVELLHDQSNPRNLCDAVVSGAPLNCHETAAERPVFETDQTRVTIVRIAPGASAEFSGATPKVLVGLEGIAAESPHGAFGPAGVLDVHANSSVKIRNTGKSTARIMQVEFPAKPAR